MKFRPAFALLLFLPAIFLACAGKGFDFGEGSTFLWKVSDADSHVWILGSIHYADESFYPLAEPIEAAFEASVAVAAELDVSDEAVREESVDEFSSRCCLAGGETLEGMLGDSLWARFEKVAAGLGMPAKGFTTFRPWFAAMALSGMAFQKSGLDPLLGIDFVLLDRARDEGKEIIELETPAEQASALAPDTSDEDGVRYLRETLDEIETLDSLLQGLMTAWKTGDIAGFREFISAEDSGEMDRRLYEDRNFKMASQVERFLSENREVFVIVGAAHLVVREDNVLSILRRRGYSVERK